MLLGVLILLSLSLEDICHTVGLTSNANTLLQRKPYSAITVQIDRLTSEQFEEDDFSGIIDLIEVIRIQASGPTEAARAIRKKL